jgi:CHAT domain-containing protein
MDAYAKNSPSTAPTSTVVGVTHTASNGSNFVKGVEQEVKNIISIVKQPYVQCLLGQQATVDAVKLKLQSSSWVHLACHGCQSLLELETLLRMPLPNAQFVFLAASQTATGDAKLINESFHLGGGFMTAGFQSVIGTRSMNGPTVAGIVYSHLFCKG